MLKKIMAALLFCGLLATGVRAIEVSPVEPEDIFTQETIEQEKAEAASKIRVTVYGVPVAWTDAEPFIDANDRTMVPLRAVADALGLAVDWDAAAREAIFTDGAKTIYFPIDSSTARTSEGNTVPMDTAAVIVNERTYAPVRYLAAYFGYTVDWDGSTRTVVIQ